MKPTIARYLIAICAAALFFCLFINATQAELPLPNMENQTMGSGNSVNAKQVQGQQSGMAGSTGGISSQNLNFTSNNTVKGNINAAGGAQVNMSGLNLSAGKSGTVTTTNDQMMISPIVSASTPSISGNIRTTPTAASNGKAVAGYEPPFL